MPIDPSGLSYLFGGPVKRSPQTHLTSVPVHSVEQRVLHFLALGRRARALLHSQEAGELTAVRVRVRAKVRVRVRVAQRKHAMGVS